MSEDFSLGASKIGFTAWCEFITGALVLDTLEVSLAVEETTLIRLIKDQGQASDFMAARHLPVKRLFDFSFWVGPNCEDVFVNGADAREVCNRARLLEEEYKPIVREWMLPDSLRVKVNTETERYIQARLE